MNSKRNISPFLIAFFLLSFGYLAFRSGRSTKNCQDLTSVQAAVLEKGSTAPAKRVEEGSKIIAYYFHVNVRCITCRTIESYSKEIIQGQFAKEIASGRVEWRLVNIQNPENRHFIQDYQLFTRSLVLVLYKNGQQKEFKVLNDTWQLVGDKAAMQRYVENEVRGFLRKS